MILTDQWLSRLQWYHPLNQTGQEVGTLFVNKCRGCPQVFGSGLLNRSSVNGRLFAVQGRPAVWLALPYMGWFSRRERERKSHVNQWKPLPVWWKKRSLFRKSTPRWPLQLVAAPPPQEAGRLTRWQGIYQQMFCPCVHFSTQSVVHSFNVDWWHQQNVKLLLMLLWFGASLNN